MFKVYRTISAYPVVKLAASYANKELVIRGKLTTDDEDLQAFIEKKGSFKRGFIYIDQEMTDAANDGVSESDIDEYVDGADDADVVQPELGKVYAMSDLLKMKVPELRGILGKLGVKYVGLNKQALIQSILHGKRCE